MLSLTDLIHIFFFFSCRVCYVFFLFTFKKEKSSLIFPTFEYAYLFLCVLRRGQELRISLDRLQNIHTYDPIHSKINGTGCVKYFGLAKRKSNISRNNHFAVIVGASIGPVSTPSHDIIYFFFHLTHSTPLFVISLPFFRRNMYVYLSCEIVGGCCYFQKKRRRKDM